MRSTLILFCFDTGFHRGTYTYRCEILRGKYSNKEAYVPLWISQQHAYVPLWFHSGTYAYRCGATAARTCNAVEIPQWCVCLLGDVRT